MSEHPEGCRAKVATAVMDMETCDECASWDGVELALEDERLAMPNPDCTCPDGCRCCWVYIMNDESPSLIPGPKPPR